MSRFSKVLTQVVFVAAASLSSMVMMQASTASAQPSTSATTGGYFRAELATPVERTTKIIQGVVWQCEGTVCNGAKATSRPINVCTRLSRKMGEVTAFSARNQPMANEDLTSCNADG